jgi:hypothetical protein
MKILGLQHSPTAIDWVSACTIVIATGGVALILLTVVGVLDSLTTGRLLTVIASGVLAGAVGAQVQRGRRRAVMACAAFVTFVTVSQLVVQMVVVIGALQ